LGKILPTLKTRKSKPNVTWKKQRTREKNGPFGGRKKNGETKFD